MKRIGTFLLAILMVLTLLPSVAAPAEAAPGSKLVALTFDDGPGSYTKQLLDGLKERGVPVTFFFLGSLAENRTSVVKRAYEEGHEIASHTWDHPDLTGESDSEIRQQIEKTEAALDLGCGAGTEYLVRPPYGSTNQRVRDAIDAPLIYWSVDSEDWRLLNTAKVRDKICHDTYDGCIILCHDIHKTTVPAALEAIDILQDAGYEFVTVSELFRRRGRELEDHKLHYNSNRNGVDLGPIPAPSISLRHNGDGRFTVTITCKDAKAPIYYTLDGSYPNQEAKRYTGPFTVDYFSQITAVAAYNLNGSRSELTRLKMSAYPCLEPEMGLDSAGRLVLSTLTPGAKLYYSLDGTYPTESDLRYTGPATIPGDSYVRAVAVHAEAGASTDAGPWYYSDYGKLYSDMEPGDWFYADMERMHLAGILNGTDTYTMSPAGTLTRGMLVTLLQRCSGESLGKNWKKTNSFTDVKKNAYYAESIEWAWRYGIVNGYSSKAFGPDDPVTREQLCKIVHQYLCHMDMPPVPGGDVLDDFTDSHRVSSWAAESVAALVKAGIIRGDGNAIIPGAKANRAQVSAILSRILDYGDAYVPLVITLQPEALELVEGDQAFFEFDYTGDWEDLRWIVSDPAVASVSAEGVLTAWRYGDTTVTLTDGLTSAQCRVHVEPAIPWVERIEFLSADGPFENRMTGYAGDAVTVTVRTLPADALDGIVAQSADPDVVRVIGGEPDENGVTELTIEFVGAGSTQVTFTSEDGAQTMVFHIDVMETYSFDPGDDLLTPADFADYATRVLREAGLTAARGGNWRLLRLMPEELTFDGAVETARACIHTWWPEGIRNGKILYVGQNDAGQYEFRLCWD